MQIGRALAIQRRDGTTKDVVQTAVLTGALDGDDVLGLLDDTDHRLVPARVAAVLTLLVGGDVEADVTEPGLLLDLTQRIRQRADLLVRSVQDVEGDALGALGADARQLRQGIDEVLKRTVVHVVSSSSLWHDR